MTGDFAGKPCSGNPPQATQGTGRTDDGAAQPEPTEPHGADGQRAVAVHEAEPEQSAISADLLAALRSVEEKFDELPVSKWRMLLAE